MFAIHVPSIMVPEKEVDDPIRGRDVIIKNIMAGTNYYEVLEIRFDATESEIRKQYLRKSKVVHPGRQERTGS